MKTTEPAPKPQKDRRRPRIIAPVVKRRDEPPREIVRERLLTEEMPRNAVTRAAIELVRDGLGQSISVPVLVARGRREGPVLGITAAVHGNELNGLRAIHDVFDRLDVDQLRGTVVGVIAVNVPGLHNHKRLLTDGKDLNHIFPGHPNGDVAQVYAHRFVDRVLSSFDFLVDLHTASFGRVNSLYVRADLKDDACARMAYLQRPQIIVHNPVSDRTLRGTAMELGIPSITVEIGDPQRFQPNFIRSCANGIRRVMADARMLSMRAVKEGDEPILCGRSFWIYADRGGLLEVIPKPTDHVEKGEVVARLRNAYGDVVREYAVPSAGVVIGKSVNPVGPTGARILHLGVVAPPDHPYAKREHLPHLADAPSLSGQ